MATLAFCFSWSNTHRGFLFQADWECKNAHQEHAPRIRLQRCPLIWTRHLGPALTRLLSPLRAPLLLWFMPPASDQAASVLKHAAMPTCCPPVGKHLLHLPDFVQVWLPKAGSPLPSPHAASPLCKINLSLLCALTWPIYCHSLSHHGSLYYTWTLYCSLLGAKIMSYSKLSVPGLPDLFHIKEHLENERVFLWCKRLLVKEITIFNNPFKI